ncbi:Ig-like domain-containing protein [Streptomyces albogriseolus]|uniref:ErfK/YbiS/YcfS/YnhG family protein n=2 Tax=unclassified Streptomyces TaxID=2593676 RepID=V9Z7Q7_9ACTN|nr:MULTISPECIES: Ig-like domain-containing protein [unclassified Streptomyces]AHE38917.1 Erfk/ybis/ycfs/ynhg family protein [Streptomyces sp. FR1]AHE39401.1 ErfK/YbiS/YcfS/YnhG family protein [Streptomyces sp. F2]
MRQRLTARLVRRTVQPLALASAAVVALAACSAGGTADSSSDMAGSDGKNGGPAAIAVEPGADSEKVPVSRKVTVRAQDGSLSSVDVSSPGPGKLSGTWSEDKSVWTSTTPLAPGATYTVNAKGEASDGSALTESASFTTEAAQNTFVGTYNPDKGTKVGVAMPVSITFNKPVHDKAAVERKLKVTASPAVEGAWSWMKDRDGKDRVDYRPQKYWKPGTKVTLRMDLAGVNAGGGVYGTQQRVVNFTIGDAVTSTVDVVKKTMTVAKNGKTLRTLKVSTGKKDFETWNGTMVVLSKVPTIRMNSASVGIFGPEAYDLGEVKWDVQLTPSGTYAHAAPWNEGKFGVVNGSHGCIGMSTADAKWFYDQVHLGDPVTVVNSVDTVAVNNGYGDWNVDWATWKKGSALD